MLIRAKYVPRRTKPTIYKPVLTAACEICVVKYQRKLFMNPKQESPSKVKTQRRCKMED